MLEALKTKNKPYERYTNIHNLTIQKQLLPSFLFLNLPELFLLYLHVYLIWILLHKHVCVRHATLSISKYQIKSQFKLPSHLIGGNAIAVDYIVIVVVVVEFTLLKPSSESKSSQKIEKYGCCFYVHCPCLDCFQRAGNCAASVPRLVPRLC